MHLRSELGKGVVYLQLLTSILGCQNREATKPQSAFNRAGPTLESTLDSNSVFTNIKIGEAKQDIEQILASDFMKHIKKDSELTFDHIMPTGNFESLYLLRYRYGDKITINYYCQKNNNKFERYAREILFEIRAEPYFFQVRFFGNESEGVNPDKKMRVIMTKYKIETKDGIEPEYKQTIRPKHKLI